MAEPVDDATASALIAELGKKTSVCWLRYSVYGWPATEHAVWHVWHDDALLLVSGGTEQPIPDLEDAEWVEVIMRSKDNGGRLVTWIGVPRRVMPDSPEWAASAAALASERISIASSVRDSQASGRSTRWFSGSSRTVSCSRHPDSLSPSSHAAAPRKTSATTRGPLPRILHRRKTRRPRLS